MDDGQCEMNVTGEPRFPPGPPPHRRRVLIRGVNWLGDAVMTTPALLRLREAHPDWEISILTRDSLADLWQHHRAVDRVICFDKKDSPWTIGRKLNRFHFNLALALPNSIRSALELRLARIPQRIGYSVNPIRRLLLTTALPNRPHAVAMKKKSANEIRRILRSHHSENRLPSFASRVSPQAHHLFHYLHLVGHLGANVEPLAPRIDVTPAEELVFRESRQLAEDLPLFGLNPGAEYGPAKRWPAERFIEAAAEIQRKTGGRWLIFGGRGDIELAEKIGAGIRRALAQRTEAFDASRAPLNLAGRTTLRELCAGLKVCRFLLTNDTGPMHVAAAVGTPVIVPFGSTSPELTGPGLPGDSPHVVLRSDVPCAPCFLRTCPIDFRCMNNITVDQVANAAVRMAMLSR